MKKLICVGVLVYSVIILVSCPNYTEQLYHTPDWILGNWEGGMIDLSTGDETVYKWSFTKTYAFFNGYYILRDNIMDSGYEEKYYEIENMDKDLLYSFKKGEGVVYFSIDHYDGKRTPDIIYDIKLTKIE